MGSVCVRFALLAGCLADASDLLHAGDDIVPTEPETERTYAWIRDLDHGSFEHAVVERRGKAISIEGDVLATHEGQPLRLMYSVSTDEDGIGRSVRIQQHLAGRSRTLLLDRTEDGSWFVDGQPAPGLAGCLDIDLGFTPSTNALPINRILRADAAAEEIEVRAAWVRFPSLEVVPAVQRYTRLAPQRWRYESMASGFTAVIEVDDWALPASYEGVWTRLGMTRGARQGRSDGFASALLSDGPAPELGDRAQDFDWLVGGWSATVKDFADDGGVRVSRGEWWFSWVLEGRAMQDVWISPPRDERRGRAGDSAPNGRYGTTLRRFDRTQGVWRVTWINPVTGAENELIGRRRGDAIVLLGTAGGRPIRWQFVDISTSSFTWQGFQLEPDGATWRLQAEFELQRL